MQVFTEFSLLISVNQICNPAGAEPIRRHQQKMVDASHWMHPPLTETYWKYQIVTIS